jgi:hypothetical protein
LRKLNNPNNPVTISPRLIAALRVSPGMLFMGYGNETELLNNPHTMKSAILITFVAGLLIGCVSETRITSTWSNVSRTKTYSSIVVAALTHDVNAKSIVENNLTTSLKNKGVVASKSLDVFPPNFTKDVLKEEMLQKIRQTGAEAIITITLIDTETKREYVPGSTGFVSPGFTGYYVTMYPLMYSPGYYTEDKVYYIETNMYDAATEQLIWSAQSETYNPQNLSGFSTELANKITNRLYHAKIIVPFKSKKITHANKTTVSM